MTRDLIGKLFLAGTLLIPCDLAYAPTSQKEMGVVENAGLNELSKLVDYKASFEKINRGYPSLDLGNGSRIYLLNEGIEILFPIQLGRDYTCTFRPFNKNYLSDFDRVVFNNRVTNKSDYTSVKCSDFLEKILLEVGITKNS